MKRIVFLAILSFSFAATAQDFTIVFLNKKLDKAELPEGEVKKLMDGHMANMNRLAKEDKLWAAGPFDGGGGIFIFNSGSEDDVKEWIKTDPGIAAKRWDIEILSYIPRIGSVCAVGEKYEMTHYYFVRFMHNQIPGPAMDAAHQDHVKSWSTNSIVTEALLNAGQGLVLVLKEEPAPEDLSNDPLIKSGSSKADLKKLYIAKGSFCEQK